MGLGEAHDRIDLYVGLLDAIDTSVAFDACRAILSPAEMDRAGRFAFERHRRQYVFAHGLLRFALSDVVPQIDPSDWYFEADRHGRPFVMGPSGATEIYFSLSHTEGCVACAVSGYQAVGVDVELVRPRGQLLEIARDVFSPEEIEALYRLPTGERIDRFFHLWTLKEAYLKAEGIGLRQPLDRFSMQITSDGIGIGFGPEIDDDPQRWRFTTSLPSPAHRLAVADGSGTEGGLPIVLHSWPPSRSA
jgi:4'-phosphopantetheinyl transferase